MASPVGLGATEQFHLERYFAKHEFSAPHLLCCSDAEPLFMSELLTSAPPDLLDQFHGLRLSYTETPGLPALRAEIASMYASITPEDVVVAAPEEVRRPRCPRRLFQEPQPPLLLQCVFLAMHACLRPGDRVVVTFPGYQSLYELARSLGCQVIHWEVGGFIPLPRGIGDSPQNPCPCFAGSAD